MHVFFNVWNLEHTFSQQAESKVKTSRTTLVVDGIIKVWMVVKIVNGLSGEVCATVSYHVKCKEHSVGTM